MTADVLLASGGAVAVLLLATWLVSLPLRDVSIVDIVWGLGFVAVAWTAFAVGDGDAGRRLLMAVLVSAWGLRLAVHLARRNLGKGEDFRYVRMRKHHGDRFPLVSLVTVFGLQAMLIWVVALPVTAAAARDEALGVLDWTGVALWAVGLYFEAVGDHQLARFKADPQSAGQVMDRGLWRYTRHPNYFGDFCAWWGLWLIALSAGAWWAVIGPLVMSTLLIRISGVAMLERDISKRRPGYAEYIRRTSAFFPRPPR